MHWLQTFYFGYLWPSLKGNGPEAIAQTFVYGVIAVIFVPIIRRFTKAELNKVHAKLDHVIHHHPEIPDYKEPGKETT